MNHSTVHCELINNGNGNCVGNSTLQKLTNNAKWNIDEKMTINVLINSNKDSLIQGSGSCIVDSIFSQGKIQVALVVENLLEVRSATFIKELTLVNAQINGTVLSVDKLSNKGISVVDNDLIKIKYQFVNIGSMTASCHECSLVTEVDSHSEFDSHSIFEDIEWINYGTIVLQDQARLNGIHNFGTLKVEDSSTAFLSRCENYNLVAVRSLLSVLVVDNFLSESEIEGSGLLRIFSGSLSGIVWPKIELLGKVVLQNFSARNEIVPSGTGGELIGVGSAKIL
jgi:hypothetical protein